MSEEFAVKDSGQRVVFDSGMKRDVDTDKIGYHLITGGPMFKRWAVHLTKGAKKYDEDNWMKAEGEAELTRFRKSAMRHFMQWWNGERDEDHAAAVFFNVNGAEYVREKLVGPSTDEWYLDKIMHPRGTVLEPVVPADPTPRIPPLPEADE